MIDRVNQKPFLLWQAQAMLRAGSGEPETHCRDEELDVSDEEIAAATEAVASAIELAFSGLCGAIRGAKRGPIHPSAAERLSAQCRAVARNRL
jgi:hypothetical protein